MAGHGDVTKLQFRNMVFDLSHQLQREVYVADVLSAAGQYVPGETIRPASNLRPPKTFRTRKLQGSCPHLTDLSQGNM